MNVPNNNLKVKLWDLGPKRAEPPVAPVAPVESDFKGKVADFAVAQIQFEDALVDYKNALRAYAKQREDYDKWRAQYGGPVEVEFWTVSANEALHNDPERYSRKLPRGHKPGPAHLENERKAAERLVEDAHTAERDPHFGKGTVHEAA